MALLDILNGLVFLFIVPIVCVCIGFYFSNKWADKEFRTGTASMRVLAFVSWAHANKLFCLNFAIDLLSNNCGTICRLPFYIICRMSKTGIFPSRDFSFASFMLASSKWKKNQPVELVRRVNFHSNRLRSRNIIFVETKRIVRKLFASLVGFSRMEFS